MQISDCLIPQDMKDQCDSAIRKLEQDNENIRILQKNLKNFISDDELEGEAFDALKMQISDYLTVTTAMMTANEYDIEDYQILKGAVGEEELDGYAIQTGKSNALSDMNGYTGKAATYYRLAQNMPVQSPLQTWYSSATLFYESLALNAERKYEVYLELEQSYDEIEAATWNLFSRSVPMRNIAKQGMTGITGAFQDGTYHIDMNASWRTDYQTEFTKMIQNTKADFVTTNADGTQEYNWDYIQEWLGKDADEVSEVEYLAFIDVMSGMSPEEMDMLFTKAQVDASPFNHTGCDVSGVMTEAAERYLYIAEMEAEVTLFNAHCIYDYDEISISNELSKAVLIYQVVDEMTTTGVGRRHDVSITAAEDSKGKITYVAQVSVYSLNSGSLGENLAAESLERTITVKPWGTPATVEMDLEDFLETTIISMNPSSKETVGGFVGDATMCYVFSKIGEKTAEEVGGILSYSLLTMEFMMDLKEDYETSVKLSGAINELHMGQAMDALGLYAEVVKVEGATESSSVLYCLKYDPEELLVRVAAYNSENEPPITVEQLKAGFENDDEVFEAYKDWFYEGGDKEIEEYWGELGRIAMEYQREHPEIELEDRGNMTTEQLQELINKYNDPAYEINEEIMGEQE